MTELPVKLGLLLWNKQKGQVRMDEEPRQSVIVELVRMGSRMRPCQEASSICQRHELARSWAGTAVFAGAAVLALL